MIDMEISRIGDFMAKLLTGRVFDPFLLVEGNVRTFAAFHVDGDLNRDFFSAQEQEKVPDDPYVRWAMIRPYVYQLMKGHNLPLSFHFTLQLAPKDAAHMLEKNGLDRYSESLTGMYLNIRYREERLSCVTGISSKTFIMDKRPEQLWDEIAAKYLKKNGIAFESR